MSYHYTYSYPGKKSKRRRLAAILGGLALTGAVAYGLREPIKNIAHEALQYLFYKYEDKPSRNFHKARNIYEFPDENFTYNFEKKRFEKTINEKDMFGKDVTRTEVWGSR